MAAVAAQAALAIPEIVSLVCQHLYLATETATLDPPLISGHHRQLYINTLQSLCRVSRLFHAEATPFLYRHVSIAIPASFETLIGTIGVEQDVQDDTDTASDAEYDGVHRQVADIRIAYAEDDYDGRTDRGSVGVRSTDKSPSSSNLLGARCGIMNTSRPQSPHSLPDDLLGTPRVDSRSPERSGRRRAGVSFHAPEDSVSPPASREASRSRSLSRGRRSERSRSRSKSRGPESRYFQDGEPARAPIVEVARPWRAGNPGLHTYTLTFEKFRSHGLKRSVGEGSRQRFVTSERVLQILRGTRGPGALNPDDEKDRDEDEDEAADLAGARNLDREGKLEAVGFTEYIDSSLNIDVLEEILLRGGYRSKSNLPDPSKLRGTSLALASHPVQALDLCGCVSRTFIDAVTEFIDVYDLNNRETEFPHLQRLGLFGLTISAALLDPLIMAFPNLTHLDLSSTRTSPALPDVLEQCGQSATLRLQSLSLAKCQALTSESIRNFMVSAKANVFRDMNELNLYYDATSAVPLTAEHLRDIITTSPVFTSGKLRFLDISSSLMTDELLAVFPEQPCLLELGMSHCPNISWKALRDFLNEKASGVEILNIRSSCRLPVFPVTAPARTARRNDANFNTIFGIHQYLATSYQSAFATPALARLPEINLRVIELDEKVLDAIDASGAHKDWKVFYGKGWRGWYVNCALEPIPSGTELADGQLVRQPVFGEGKRVLRILEERDERRLNMLYMAGKSKSGGYNFGWHARKMTVLNRDGMLGREHGLYNFHSYS